MLKAALARSDHTHEGYSAVELVEGLTKLASHKENSEAIMENKIAASLLRMLTEYGKITNS